MTINGLSLELHARSWLKERVWLQEKLVDDLKPVGTTVMNTITNTLCTLDPILQRVSRQPQLWIIILSCEHCITDAKPETFTQFFCIWATSALAICTKLSNTNTYTWGSVCSAWESWSIPSAVRAPSMERIWVILRILCRAGLQCYERPNYTGSRMKDCCLIPHNQLSEDFWWVPCAQLSPFPFLSLACSDSVHQPV